MKKRDEEHREGIEPCHQTMSDGWAVKKRKYSVALGKKFYIINFFCCMV